MLGPVKRENSDYLIKELFFTSGWMKIQEIWFQLAKTEVEIWLLQKLKLSNQMSMSKIILNP